MNGTVHPYYTVALAPPSPHWSGWDRCGRGGPCRGWDGRIALAAMLGAGGLVVGRSC